MSSFDNFYNRLQTLNEARKSPVEALVPGAAGVTSQMRSAGLSSAPLDTIKFIRELLFNLDVISEDQLNFVKSGKGFTGKKQAMLKVLQDSQDAINAKSDEIAQTIESTLDDFISGMGVNRSREEKYAAQAAAQELAAQARAAKSGKEMDDALADVISDEKLLIKASLAKAIQELEDLPGGEDISPDVLAEIKAFAPKINTLEQLESFVKQLSAMEEYQLPAAYLSSTVKAIKGGMEDAEMEDQEDPDFDAAKADLDDDGELSEYEKARGEAIAAAMEDEAVEDYEDEVGVEEVYPDDMDPNQDLEELEDEDDDEEDEEVVAESKYSTADYLTDIYSSMENIVLENTIDENGKITPTHQYLAEKAEQAIEDAYTAQYLMEQKAQDSLPKRKKEKSLSFKERFQPKTHWQLDEVRRYGL